MSEVFIGALVGIFSGLITLAVGLLQYRHQRDKTKADVATLFEGLAAKSAERVGKLEIKVDALNAIIEEQTGVIESQSKEIEYLKITVNEQASTINNQAVQIKNLNKKTEEQALTIKALQEENTSLRAELDKQS